VVDLGAWIRSYFNNYIYYKWQRSTNNGLSWVDASSVGTGSPIWNGSNWEYYTAYPSFVSTSADSGTKFRVVVASTAANISNPSCSFADVTSILTLNVINCSFLNTDIVSFSGRADGSIIKLNWTSSREEGAVQYIIEKSSDGKNFTSAGSVQGLNSNNEVNYYSWSENYLPNQTLFYRVRLVTADRQKISRTVKIISASKEFEINIINPFTHSLMAEVTAAEPQLVFFKLIDNSGRILREEKFALTTGTNSLQIANTGNLPKGLYTLQIQSGAKLFVSKKVLKL
jgi:hypothetical protein